MQANFSDSFWELLKAWYSRKSFIEDETFRLDKTTGGDIYKAYTLGVRDGKSELARDIFEHLDLINHN